MAAMAASDAKPDLAFGAFAPVGRARPLGADAPRLSDNRRRRGRAGRRPRRGRPAGPCAARGGAGGPPPWGRTDPTSCR